MRLPGTRYQEHGWEQVRKLLGQCSLQACADGFMTRVLAAATAAQPLADGLADRLEDRLDDCLEDYLDRCGAALRAGRGGPRATADGNSYGESVFELALALLYELQARPADWHGFASAVAAEAARLGPFWRHAGGDAILRKKFNDMYAVLRDKVDCDNYSVACGRPCSANRMYAYRMLDTAYADIARLFGSWHAWPEQVGAILGRAVSTAAAPIEVRQMKSIGDCQAAWVIAWSASRERFTGEPGPLHTRSKRFASLKNSGERIAAMLAEIGDYEQLSANRDGPWQQDAFDAGAWLADLARVLDDDAAGAGPDRLLAAVPDDVDVDVDVDADADADDADAVNAVNADNGAAVATSGSAGLCAAPGYASLTALVRDPVAVVGRALADCSLPVRLAVYLKLLGAADDCYPAEWLDGATGQLPTMAQLAAQDGVSLPTLRKRRDGAIAALRCTSTDASAAAKVAVTATATATTIAAFGR